MELILKKFAIQENVEWSKHLSKAEDAVQEEPFPEFMKWLQRDRIIMGAVGSSENQFQGKGKGNYFGRQDGSGGDNSCYGCGETAHYKHDCLIVV